MLAGSFEAIVLSSFSFLVRNATLLCPSPGQVQARLRLCLDDIRLWRGPCDFGVAQLRRLSGDSVVRWPEREMDRTGCEIIWKTCRNGVVD